MTQDEIIAMALGIGLEYRKNNNEIITPYCDGVHIDELQLFAKLVAAHEREACANVIENYPNWIGKTAKTEISNAIRARGQQ